MAKKREVKIANKIAKQALLLMAQAKEMTHLYEENFALVSKYVHATSRGHEAIQIAIGMQLGSMDFAFPYYRDDAMMLAIGMRPYDMMLQLMAKREDPFSGGRSYYCHPSLSDPDKVKIPHQSSATGMQAIPATGAALGLRYKEIHGMNQEDEKPLVLCSLGDASVTEGEVAEAFQMAALKQLPICFLIQDNEWDISAYKDEVRSMDASEYIKGFVGIESITIDGTNFANSYIVVQEVFAKIRKERRPFLIHAKVPLLNHHTSGVRMEWYRDDLDKAKREDPFPKFLAYLKKGGWKKSQIDEILKEAKNQVLADFELAIRQDSPSADDLYTHDFAPTTVIEEQGTRQPKNGKEVIMVDAGLIGIKEIMKEDKRCLLYGQDVGKRLGGVFREAATLAETFGDERVFNTPIQEAFIVGSTVGMSAVGLKPIVEVQFADYLWPGMNQLFSEVSRSCYLSNGKYPVSMILRVPIGAYGSGGPYHSSSIESTVCNIRGIKIAYPSNSADFKGLLKAAYLDPNPVVIFEHKGLYWSKVPGTQAAKSIMPAEDYILPFGKAKLVQTAVPEYIESGESMCIVSYGMGIHWALNASKEYQERVEILDLRTLHPLDEEMIVETVKKHGRCMVLSESAKSNSFGQALAGMIQEHCFQYLDAPVLVIGSSDMPAIPLNENLENAMLPSIEEIKDKIAYLLQY